MRWMVTGGCGFIGSHFVRLLLSRPDVERVVNLDALTYAGNPANLESAHADPRYLFHQGDVADREAVAALLAAERPEFLINFAAESHVDRSITDSLPFLHTNVLGAHALLEAWRQVPGRRFVQISTDEVYGSLPAPALAREDSPLRPSSPYAASKAAADLLVASYFKTHGVDAVITRCGNNIGPNQMPEKLVPRMILHALANRPLPLYGDGGNIRDWIYVEDHCRAVMKVALRGEAGGVYNIGASAERTNLEVVYRILELVGTSESAITFVSDRPGHDRRYALDFGRMRQRFGWMPQVPFDQALRRTVRWYQRNTNWWAPLLDREAPHS